MPASQALMTPSLSTARRSEMAAVKKPTSRRNGPRLTLNGLINAMDPTTTETIKDAAPISSPMARLPESAFMAENVEKTSGLPLPKARNVTPATFSSRPRTADIVARFGQKKSDALMPKVEKRKMSQMRRPIKYPGRIRGDEQKYFCTYVTRNSVFDLGHDLVTCAHCSLAGNIRGAHVFAVKSLFTLSTSARDQCCTDLGDERETSTAACCEWDHRTT